jgi:hypothetical protein
MPFEWSAFLYDQIYEQMPFMWEREIALTFNSYPANVENRTSS